MKVLKAHPGLTLAIVNTVVVLVACTVWSLYAAGWSLQNIWLTPDQRAERLMNAGRYEEAARDFTDPFRSGVALFKAKIFEEAAGSFARINTAEAAYNRGNALVMLGKYEDAVASYERALQQRPDWSEAKTNRDIAQARWKMLQPPESDSGGTGGQLEADEFVFDSCAKNSTATQQIAGAGEQLSDAALRALWLRRVQTRPADFLRAKFAYQLSRRSAEVPRK